MKLLYWLSYIPTAPFWAVSWILFGMAFCICYVGNFIHDKTTSPLWRKIHLAECKKNFPRTTS